MTGRNETRRRTALNAALAGGVGVLLSTVGCTRTRSPKEGPQMTHESPSAQEALRSVGIPEPGVELSVRDGISVSDLDEWSVRVSFSASPEDVRTWTSTAFDGAEGLPVTADGASISQRFRPEEIREGSRYITGSNPSDPSAIYIVLISPEGTDVVIAAARVSR